MSGICSRCGKGEGKIRGSLDENITLQNFLEKTKYSFLCSSCETDLNKLLLTASSRRFPSAGTEVKELDYTVENGLVVFTEFYHLSRGTCCENNCRNCAYGYRLRS